MTGAAQGVSQVQREGEVLSLMGKRREAAEGGRRACRPGALLSPERAVNQVHPAGSRPAQAAPAANPAGDMGHSTPSRRWEVTRVAGSARPPTHRRHLAVAGTAGFASRLCPLQGGSWFITT